MKTCFRLAICALLAMPGHSAFAQQEAVDNCSETVEHNFAAQTRALGWKWDAGKAQGLINHAKLCPKSANMQLGRAILWFQAAQQPGLTAEQQLGFYNEVWEGFLDIETLKHEKIFHSDSGLHLELMKSTFDWLVKYANATNNTINAFASQEPMRECPYGSAVAVQSAYYEYAKKPGGFAPALARKLADVCAKGETRLDRAVLEWTAMMEISRANASADPAKKLEYSRQARADLAAYYGDSKSQTPDFNIGKAYMDLARLLHDDMAENGLPLDGPEHEQGFRENLIAWHADSLWKRSFSADDEGRAQVLAYLDWLRALHPKAQAIGPGASETLYKGLKLHADGEVRGPGRKALKGPPHSLFSYVRPDK